MSGASFPAEAKLGQVSTFLKVVHTQGGKTQVSRVARELHEDLLMLLPVMDAAEKLGLIAVEKGNVKLSKAGEDLASGRPDFSQAGSSLRSVEPFTTAVALRKFTAEQVADDLVRRGVRWHHDDTVNSSVVREILTHWGIAVGLFDYDGRTGTFRTRE